MIAAIKCSLLNVLDTSNEVERKGTITTFIYHIPIAPKYFVFSLSSLSLLHLLYLSLTTTFRIKFKRLHSSLSRSLKPTSIMASNRELLLTVAVLFISASYCVIIHNVQAFNIVAPVGTYSCNIHQFHVPTSVPTLSTSVPSSFSSSSIAISYNIPFTKQFKRRIKPNHTLLFAAARKEIITPDDNIIPTTSPSHNKHPNSNLNRNEQLFQERIQQLRTFQKKYGHGSIPSPYKPNPSLGIWAANLRRQHTLSLRAEKTNRPYIGYLTSERYQTLIKEGFEFTSLTERQFQLRIAELQKFKDRFGHCNVPEKWDENLGLGAWVSNIRSLYKRRHRIQQQQTNKEAVKKKQKML